MKNCIQLSKGPIPDNSQKATVLELELDHSLNARILPNACEDVQHARAIPASFGTWRGCLASAHLDLTAASPKRLSIRIHRGQWQRRRNHLRGTFRIPPRLEEPQMVSIRCVRE
jgi:hypothetical protein